MLQKAAAESAHPDVLVELARAWFRTGDFRARAEGERLTAYERGSEAARRAIAADPHSEALPD
ncbi:MAG: hypothetical protein ACRELS_02840 [Candidatus Rokuibacteriota bacterium]